MQDFFYQQYEPVFVADDKAWDSVSQASTVPGTPSTVRPLMISFPFAQCNDDRLIQQKKCSLIYLLIYLFIYLSIYLFIYFLFIIYYLSLIYLFIHLFIYYSFSKSNKVYCRKRVLTPCWSCRRFSRSRSIEAQLTLLMNWSIIDPQDFKSFELSNLFFLSWQPAFLNNSPNLSPDECMHGIWRQWALKPVILATTWPE